MPHLPPAAAQDTGSDNSGDELIGWLEGELSQSSALPARLRGLLAECTNKLEIRFSAGEAVERLVRLRSSVVDRVLRALWHEIAIQNVQLPRCESSQ